MGARGRDSASELSVVPIGEAERPVPPNTLSEEEKLLWRKVVNSLPPGWIRPEAESLLANYVSHETEAKEITRLIEEGKGSHDFNVAEYDRLCKMREREVRSASSLATRLRLTPQSTYDPKKSKGKGTQKAPWDS